MSSATTSTLVLVHANSDFGSFAPPSVTLALGVNGSIVNKAFCTFLAFSQPNWLQ